MSLEYVAHHMPPCFRQEPVLKAVALLVAPPCPVGQCETTAVLDGVGELTIHYQDDSENGPTIINVWAGPCNVTGMLSSQDEDELYAELDAQRLRSQELDEESRCYA